MNFTIRVSGRILKFTRLLLQNIINPKVHCNFENQALNCISTKSSFPALNNFIYTTCWDFVPILWKKTYPVPFYPALCWSVQNEYKVSVKLVYTWIALIYISFVVMKKPQQKTEENSPQLLKHAVIIHLKSCVVYNHAVLSCVYDLPVSQRVVEWWVIKLPGKATSISNPPRCS